MQDYLYPVYSAAAFVATVIHLIIDSDLQPGRKARVRAERFVDIFLKPTTVGKRVEAFASSDSLKV